MAPPAKPGTLDVEKAGEAVDVELIPLTGGDQAACPPFDPRLDRRDFVMFGLGVLAGGAGGERRLARDPPGQPGPGGGRRQGQRRRERVRGVDSERLVLAWARELLFDPCRLVRQVKQVAG